MGYQENLESFINNKIELNLVKNVIYYLIKKLNNDNNRLKKKLKSKVYKKNVFW